MAEKEDQGRWQKLLDSTLSGVVLALVLGFFAVLWNASYTVNDKLRELKASSDVLQSEVADVRAQDNRARIQDLEKQLSQQHDEIVKLKNYVTGLPAAKDHLPPMLNPPTFSGSFDTDLLKKAHAEENRIQQQIQMKKGQ